MSLILNSLVEITLEPSSKVAAAEILVVNPFFGTSKYFPLLVFDMEDFASVVTLTLLSATPAKETLNGLFSPL